MAFAALTLAGAGIEGGLATAKPGVAGAALTAGQVVRINSSNQLVVADAEVAAEDDVVGVVLSTVGSGIPVLYAPIGSVVVTSGLTAGQTYYLGGSADKGKVGLFADATTGTHFATIVGVALSASRLRIVGINTDVQL